MNQKNNPIKYCRKCGVELIIEINWTEGMKKYFHYICSPCHTIETLTIHNKKCNDENYKLKRRIDYNKSNKKRNKQLKERIVNAYGGKCACCGESNIEFLSIDHINGKGNEHRRLLKTKGGTSFYHWLEKNNFPKDNFRLLCMNCNTSIGHYGYCPHQKS